MFTVSLDCCFGGIEVDEAAGVDTTTDGIVFWVVTGDGGGAFGATGAAGIVPFSEELDTLTGVSGAEDTAVDLEAVDDIVPVLTVVDAEEAVEIVGKVEGRLGDAAVTEDPVGRVVVFDAGGGGGASGCGGGEEA